MKNIHVLKLNESTQSDDYLITRVPGGWLYERKGNIIMVDYNDEFNNNNNHYADVTPEKVIEEVRSFYNLPIDWLKRKTREGNYPLAKQIIALIMSEKLGFSQYGIADYLNYGERSTVSSGINTLKLRMRKNKEIKSAYEYIINHRL
jgi:chromosomal replication initiation ATPase DnaA